MENDKKNELTLEEMRSLTQAITYLSPLLNHIEEMHKQIDAIASSLDVLKKGHEDLEQGLSILAANIEAMQQENEFGRQDLSMAVEKLRTQLLALEAQINTRALSSPLPLPEQAPVLLDTEIVGEPPKQEEAPEEDEQKTRIKKIAEDILAGSRGRKTRTLTTTQIKQGFKATDEEADMVLEYLHARKLYSHTTHILTFPKQASSRKSK